ncbi:MAG: Spy/CpxP family protein refolding chaperone [Bauldia sp.]|nr:Spy/CpxP family protein refolding chaperone [Bauldia sp.]
MSNQENTNPAPAGRRPRIGRGFWGILAATVVGVGLAGAFAQSALSDEGGWHGRWQGPGARHAMMFNASLDPAEIDDRIERMVAHLAIEIDATDEQKSRLTTIFVGAAHDLLAIREELGDRAETAGELIDLLTGPTVDPAAVEAFRAEKLALADQASKRVAGALVDAAEVLTSEQREKIGDRLGFFVKMAPFHRG